MADFYTQTIPWKANYDETLIPPYTLPDPFLCMDGSTVTTKEEWLSKRRPELLSLFKEYFYGDFPGVPDHTDHVIIEEHPVFGGLGILRQVRFIFRMNSGRSKSVIMLLYLPKTKTPAPVFTGLTFHGNQVVSDDPKIIPTGILPYGKDNGPGAHQKRFPLKEILSRGYAYAIASYHDFMVDDPHLCWKNSVYSLFCDDPADGERLKNASAISAWAWGISRMIDYLVTLPEIDPEKILSVGHSRLGKTSLWAGANDERIKLVCVNDSGCGGAAPDRRLCGETLYSMMGICNDFSYWFCDKMKSLALTPEKLPVDQHELIGCIPPRRVAVHSATKDIWSDPHGEYLSAFHAGPVFKLFGMAALDSETPPPPDTPVGTDVSYFCRTGGHDILLADFEHYMDCADRIFGR